MSLITNMCSLYSVAGHALSTAIHGNSHDMKDHVFTPSAYGCAQLYYQGDVPILEVLSDEPYDAGYSQGVLLGSSLQNLFEQLNVLQMITKQRSQDVASTLAAIRRKIPKKYLEEMKGLVDGFNEWRKTNNLIDKRAITEDEFLFVHLMPDSLHFDPQSVEEPPKKPSQKRKSTLACTVVIGRDKEKGITFGRNMDWPTFGVGTLGTLSLLINRKYSDPKKHSTVEVAFPGFLGTITGMNDTGLSLAMNVCGGDTQEVHGMPAAFFNRFCLEQAQEVDDVAAILKNRSPLGDYHLTVADSDKACSFHLYQGPRGNHVVRPLSDKSPLITTNCRYPSRTKATDDMNDSIARTKAVTKLFTKASAKKSKKTIAQLVKESLTIPPVNASITIHQIVMYPESKKLSVAFDNQFAGAVSLHKVDTSELLSSPEDSSSDPDDSPTEEAPTPRNTKNHTCHSEEVKDSSSETSDQSDDSDSDFDPA